uniref:Uncharacterized protein n=1 Tax=viral metagenome TaxID=1070528 RepID=A0A6M3JT99_9ZZZZ
MLAVRKETPDRFLRDVQEGNMQGMLPQERRALRLGRDLRLDRGMRAKMDMRELRKEMDRTGAEPITILYAKAYGTLDQLRSRK